MDEEKYQKELFEFEKPKRFLPKLSDFFPKGDFERNVILTLTLDRAVFMAIGIIMAMVVVYALGVESGKSKAQEIAQPVTTALPAAAIVTPAQVAGSLQPVAIRQGQPVRATAPIMQNGKVPAQTVAIKVPPAKSAPSPSVPVASVTSNPGMPYTIVAVTFTRKDTAAQEIDKLKKQSFAAELIQSDRFFLVCIGSYADRTGSQSQKDLKRVRRLYKDAYLKLR